MAKRPQVKKTSSTSRSTAESRGRLKQQILFGFLGVMIILSMILSLVRF